MEQLIIHSHYSFIFVQLGVEKILKLQLSTIDLHWNKLLHCVSHSSILLLNKDEEATKKATSLIQQRSVPQEYPCNQRGFKKKKEEVIFWVKPVSYLLGRNGKHFACSERFFFSNSEMFFYLFISFSQVLMMSPCGNIPWVIGRGIPQPCPADNNPLTHSKPSTAHFLIKVSQASLHPLRAFFVFPVPSTRLLITAD